MKTALTIAATAAAALLLAGCGGDDTASTTTTAETTTAETTTETETTETTTTAETTPTTVAIVVSGGKVNGGIQRPKVDQGDHVVIVVTSDVADEVHLHGYDLHADVEAGGKARIPFVATIPGRFEVELEEKGLQLAEITVTP